MGSFKSFPSFTRTLSFLSVVIETFSSGTVVETKARNDPRTFPDNLSNCVKIQVIPTVRF